MVQSETFDSCDVKLYLPKKLFNCVEEQRINQCILRVNYFRRAIDYFLDKKESIPIEFYQIEEMYGEKSGRIQLTLPKEMIIRLDSLCREIKEFGVKTSRTDMIRRAVKYYIDSNVGNEYIIENKTDNSRDTKLEDLSMGELKKKEVLSKIAKNRASEERERLALKVGELKHLKDIKEVVPYKLARYLFLGHSAKLATDLLSMPRQLMTEIEGLVMEKQTDKIIKLVESRIGEIIQEVKDSLISEMKEYGPDD